MSLIPSSTSLTNTVFGSLSSCLPAGVHGSAFTSSLPSGTVCVDDSTGFPSSMSSLASVVGLSFLALSSLDSVCNTLATSDRASELSGTPTPQDDSDATSNINVDDEALLPPPPPPALSLADTMPPLLSPLARRQTLDSLLIDAEPVITYPNRSASLNSRPPHMYGIISPFLVTPPIFTPPSPVRRPKGPRPLRCYGPGVIENDENLVKSMQVPESVSQNTLVGFGSPFNKNEKPQLERLQRRPFAKLNGERQSVIELAVGQPLLLDISGQPGPVLQLYIANPDPDSPTSNSSPTTPGSSTHQFEYEIPRASLSRPADTEIISLVPPFSSDPDPSVSASASYQSDWTRSPPARLIRVPLPSVLLSPPAWVAVSHPPVLSAPVVAAVPLLEHPPQRLRESGLPTFVVKRRSRSITKLPRRFSVRDPNGRLSALLGALGLVDAERFVASDD